MVQYQPFTTKMKINYNDILDPSTLLDEVKDLYATGLPTGLYLHLFCNDLSKEIFRLDLGQLALVTGIPNMGKSEFIDFVTVRLNEIYGYKTVYFSPENQPLKLHLSKLVRKFTNKQFSKDILSSDELTKTTKYIGNNFYFLNYSKVQTLEQILTNAKQLHNEKNTQILVIDNYNKLVNKSDSDEPTFIKNILLQLKAFAVENNMLVILVAHPRKMPRDTDGQLLIPSPYDICGSKQFYDDADIIVTVHRDYINNNVIIKCDKVRFANYGTVGEIRLQYDLVSGNYYGIDFNDTFESLCNNYTPPTPPKYEPFPFKIPSLNKKKKDYL